MTFYYCSFKRLFAHSQYTYTASGQKTLSASECDNPFLILKRVTNPAINDIIRIGEFFKGGHELKKKIEFDSEKKVFPIIVSIIGVALMFAMWITRLNMTAVVCVGFCCIVSALIVIGMFFKRRLYLGFLIGYCAALFGVITYYIIFGADAGFGAFTSGLAGFSSAEHPWLTGEGNFFTRLLGNLLLALPSIAVIVGVILCVVKIDKKVTLQKVLSRVLSVLLVFTTVAFVLTMNLRSKPNTERLWDGLPQGYRQKQDKRKFAQCPVYSHGRSRLWRCFRERRDI